MVSEEDWPEEEKCCMLCPRNCGRNRVAGMTGVCGVPSSLYVGRAALHFWEEPCISGKGGSGAVFFSGCQLKCVFCQNAVLSHVHDDGRKAAIPGKKITTERLSDIFLELQEQGACNINLVTPDQYAPQIVRAAETARKSGLHIPLVYNCSGYEKAEILRCLAKTVDIYLTDFKYLDAEHARRYSGAADYPERAKESLREMVNQQPEPVFDDAGMMKKGVIVRHLLLPGCVHDARNVVKYVYTEYGDRVYLSLMNQYTPPAGIKELFPELSRKVTRREYGNLVDYAIDLGVTNAFVQEGDTARESFIPSFCGEGV